MSINQLLLPVLEPIVNEYLYPNPLHIAIFKELTNQDNRAGHVWFDICSFCNSALTRYWKNGERDFLVFKGPLKPRFGMYEYAGWICSRCDCNIGIYPRRLVDPKLYTVFKT